MKHLQWLAVVFLLFACQPTTPPTITIIDNNKIITVQTDDHRPSTILQQAGITINANERVLSNGLPSALDQPISSSPITLQIRRAVPLTIVLPNGQQQIHSSALTVGQALAEASVWLRAGDKVEPELSSAINSGMTISITSVIDLAVSVDGKVLQIQSSARTVGEALAEAGIPLFGRDYSLPAENEALPSNRFAQIKVVRVSESVLLTQKPIPFESELVASADVPLDQTQILQPGENGLIVQRIRIRYEDGQEISRTTENETVVRQPKTRVLGYGTKIEIKTAVVSGIRIEYWRAVQMYATSYSPCRSGVRNCGSTTASGKQLEKGLVGMRLNWYQLMRGQPIFIPGYGHATVEDVCGGCVGKPWVDLGYSDADYEQWNSWVTVYFLTPVPANVIYVLE